MATDERRTDHTPITAEVGGEGGSFADGTYQQAERDDVRGEGMRRADETSRPNAAAEVAQNAVHRDEIAEGGVGTAPGPDEGMTRPPTE
jgi:hypothetical protein